MDLAKLEQEIYQNKVNHGFNVTDVPLEFMLLEGEIAEAFEAYRKQGRQEVAEELADVAIYLLGLAEILEIDLEKAIVAKMKTNKTRQYRDNGRGVMIEEKKR